MGTSFLVLFDFCYFHVWLVLSYIFMRWICIFVYLVLMTRREPKNTGWQGKRGLALHRARCPLRSAGLRHGAWRRCERRARINGVSSLLRAAVIGGLLVISYGRKTIGGCWWETIAGTTGFWSRDEVGRQRRQQAGGIRWLHTGGVWGWRGLVDGELSNSIYQPESI